METNHIELRDRLSELENNYADALIAGQGVSQLTALWNEIKVLRNQLNIPVYDTCTPADKRE